MKKNLLFKKNYAVELVRAIRGAQGAAQLRTLLSDYHEHDIAEALTHLTPTERGRVVAALDTHTLADIFAYLEDAAPYIGELPVALAAKVISCMDSDDALDVLESLSPEKKRAVAALLDSGAQADVARLQTYPDDEIGSRMTNNFIAIQRGLSIRGAMSELVRQAGRHDNIATLYILDEDGHYAGAIDLKDLIIARESDSLEELISRSYPYVCEHEKIADCVDRIADYAEDSIPVLTADGTLAGALTSSDLVELVDEAMGDDYAKLGGLSSEEDLKEPARVSMKKRLPWLIVLLFLGMAVSSVVGMFESVVAVLPVVICFQSLVLDMAGNVGTQSLAVTIRVLMDENLTVREQLALLAKEIKIGLLNGGSLGLMALVFLGIYIHVCKHYAWLAAFLISGCVGISLVVAMVISSMVGTLIPMLFHRIHVDPAVASGPLITTVNDLVAVVTYYGLAAIFLIPILAA